ncbi:MAG: ATPase [Acidobacteria bacterium 13_1_20CM_2_60_10]|nr:MAG: ATPase [Acidobacteria bacterium 13_1_20CM_2_60_10]PYU04885.1 MAG: ATPase [Acidobacteriota bacterium]
MALATTQIVAQLQRAIARAIYGKEEAIQQALIALLARGHLLIEDVPGVGKTTLAQALARSFHCTFQRIQFTSDLLPSDVLGVSVFNPERREFEFRPGPIFANVILADEINRTTPRTQSALLEAMNEAQVTVDGRTHVLPQPFLVIATQNPVEHHGTYPLPESQLDRFLMRIRMGYPSPETEKEILRKRTGDDPLEVLEPVAQAQDVQTMQEAVAHVHVDNSLLDYALEIVTRTRQSTELALGVSPRGTLMLQRAAQARAFLEGRDYCLPDDFKQLVVPVFAHRVIASGRQAGLPKKAEWAEALLREIVESVRVPL